jgi:hypothetical protein
VQAGLTVASIKIDGQTGSTSTLTTSSKIGLTIGVLIDVPVSNMITFQPALNYTQKGGKVTSKYTSGSSDEDIWTINNLEVPLNIIYKATGGFFVGAGPALSYAVSGTQKYTSTSVGGPGGSGTQSGEEKAYFGDGGFKRLEFSGNLLAGYQLSNGLFVSINYNMGLNNILEATESWKNRYFGFRVGKKFGNAMMRKQ